MLRLQPHDEDEPLKSLPLATLGPGTGSLMPGMRATLGRADGRVMEADRLMAWVQAFLGLLQSAAGSEDFYVKYERWQPVLKEPLQLGVGVNSGGAQVGNVGSRIKFKYGALGNTVNLGSRVQGATKHLKTALLITDATWACLDASFLTRRLCEVRVVKIAEPVTLFELAEPNRAGWEVLKKGYEQALDEFTKGEFRLACRALGRLIPDHPNDGPALLLLSRAVACLVEQPERFDPVMVLNGK